MEMPFFIDERDYPYWRLMYSLKWRNVTPHEGMSNELKGILVDTLKELKYIDPIAEADLIMSYVDGFAMTILLKEEVNRDALLNTLRKKYKS
jgi:hypothetical protein